MNLYNLQGFACCLCRITTESASVPEAETVNSVTDTSLTPEESAADQPKPRPLSPYTMWEKDREAFWKCVLCY